MANKSFFNEKLEAVKKWWDSDTTKAISTIIAVLLIPGAVLAWNYASGRNMASQENILEGESTNNVEEVTPVEENPTAETAVEPTEMPKPAVTEPEEEKTDLQIGGINEVKTLPNTSSN
jgi:hypothetical protein